MKFMLIIFGLLFIVFMFLVARTLNKPIFNKLSNTHMDDPQSRKLAEAFMLFAVLIAFLLGYLL
jgi:Kef-type K+ transport system membrane component KefB